MQPYIGQTGAAPDTIPWEEQGWAWPTSVRRGEYVFVHRRTRQRLQQRNGSGVQRHGSRSAGLGNGHKQRVPLPIHIVPLSLGDLVAPGSGEQQEHDGFGGNLVLIG